MKLKEICDLIAEGWEKHDIVKENGVEKHIYRRPESLAKEMWNELKGSWISERGRGPAWSKIRAWGVRGPGFKSQRPHHNFSARASTYFLIIG